MERTFKEIGRLQTTDSVEVVLSEVYRDKELQGFSITKYVTSEKYTGWSKGIFIPEDLLIEFLKLFNREDLECALSDKEA